MSDIIFTGEEPMSNGRKWDDGLVGAAMEIAAVNHSPLRVLAGPGTGKTFALMRRVARILQNGASGEQILVCTFTRTAAKDLETELSRLNAHSADAVRAGTIHALCFRILNRADVLTITGRAPRPLLNFEEDFLIEDLKGTAFGGTKNCKKRLRAFNAAWARLQSDEPGWPTDAVDRAFQSALLKWLRFHEAMLIGELVSETLRYLRNNPASTERRAFDHVLVDEYQDLNRAEQVLLDLFAENGTLTIIGDENQSIYTFKHAHPEGIATYPAAHDVTLIDCRRCPHLVVDLANALISNNANRDDRPLQKFDGNSIGEVYIVQWPSIENEALGIAEFIQERVRLGGVEPGRVLVLAPRRQIGYAIRDALNSLGVLAHSFFHEEALKGNPKKIGESTAQQAFTLLTLLANPDDWVALRCWCGFGSTSLNSGAWKSLIEYCESSGESPHTALQRLSSGEISISHAGGLVSRYRELQDKLSSLDGLTGQSLVDALFPDSEQWARPFRSLASNIEGDDYDAGTLREALRLGITQPELPTDVDYVRVMSLHKSKGLTAHLVVVAGCIEGLTPSKYDPTKTDLTQDQFDEEQRRLFYVAITRTRNILVLSSVTRLPKNLAYKMGATVRGGYSTNTPTITSRFINELGPMSPEPVVGNSILRNRMR